MKFHESPYACIANNPIWFIDPNGADTIKFKRTTTTTMPSYSQYSMYTDRKVYPHLEYNDASVTATTERTSTVSIVQTDAKERDVFIMIEESIEIDASGVATTTASSSKRFYPDELPLHYSGVTRFEFGVVSFPDDDRTSLAKLAPQSLTSYLYKKNKNLYSFISPLQKSIGFASAVLEVEMVAVELWAGGDLALVGRLGSTGEILRSARNIPAVLMSPGSLHMIAPSISKRLSLTKVKGGGYTKNQGKMGRHLLGHPDFGKVVGKSYFENVEEAQKVLDAYHSGKTTVLQVLEDNKVIVKFEGATGYYHNEAMILAGKPREATHIFEIVGTKQAKIVPKNPRNY